MYTYTLRAPWEYGCMALWALGKGPATKSDGFLEKILGKGSNIKMEI